jgi:ketosteroid isomerase-like protein
VDPTELADRTAIRRLVDEYAAAADHRDGPRFAAVFTTDGVLVSPTGRHVGRDALAAIPSKLERYDRTFHLVANHLVDLADDRATATGETVAEAHHWYVDDDGVARDRVLFLRYLDRFVRVIDVRGDGDPTSTWRIAERTLEVVATDVRTLSAG